MARNLWMEILLKLAAVALVSVVETSQSGVALKQCLGVTLATTATVSLAQPYLQPQINRLQTASGWIFNMFFDLYFELERIS